jgi:hypothetical protein
MDGQDSDGGRLEVGFGEETFSEEDLGELRSGVQATTPKRKMKRRSNQCQGLTSWKCRARGEERVETDLLGPMSFLNSSLVANYSIEWEKEAEVNEFRGERPEG